MKRGIAGVALVAALLLSGIATGQDAADTSARFHALGERAAKLLRPDRGAFQKDALREVRRDLAALPRYELGEDDWIDLHCVLTGIDRHLDPVPAWRYEAPPAPVFHGAVSVEARADVVALMDAAAVMSKVIPPPGTAPPPRKEAKSYAAAARKARAFADAAAKLTEDEDELVAATAYVAAEIARNLATDLQSRSRRRVPVGRERFSWTLRRRHGLDRTVEEVRRLGDVAVARCLADLEEYAARVGGGRTWQELVKLARENHPEDDGAYLEFLRRATAEAVVAAASSGLVTVPPFARRPDVKVSRSPPNMPYAHYRPGKTDPEGIFRGTAHYAASPEGLVGRDLEVWRRERDRHSFRVICAHEAVPGHHLQYAIATRVNRPLRRFGHNSSYVEGWALHSEDLLDRAGFFRDPLTRVAFLRMRLWRAVRIVVDVGLHTGGLTPEASVTMLTDVALLERPSAEAEVRRYLGSPTQPLSYLVGAERIRVMRRAYLARHGPGSEREFNDRLLGLGPVPLDLAAAVLLGKRRAYDRAHP